MSEETTPSVYLIPAGFSGWVTIEFAVTGAPPLPREDGARRFDIPPSGRLATSSPQELGIIHQRFAFVDAAGARTPIDQPDAHYGAAPDEAHREHADVVVLGYSVGEVNDAHGRHLYESFYVGRGPIDDSWSFHA